MKMDDEQSLSLDKNSINDLLSGSSGQGSITDNDLIEAFEDEDFDQEQMEKSFETLEGNAADGDYVTPDISDIEGEVAQYSSAEEMEKLLVQGGLSVDDPVRMYLKEIGQVPLLKPEQETALAQQMYAGLEATALLENRDELDPEQIPVLEKQAAAGERAKNQLVEANLRLVVSVAKRHSGKGLSFLDLIQEGNLGLLKAVEKFDCSKGF